MEGYGNNLLLTEKRYYGNHIESSSLWRGLFFVLLLIAMESFADVILPLPLSAVFTYSVTAEQLPMLCVGSRVVVPFGTKKFYTAIVRRLHNEKPEGFVVKPILEVLDSHEVVFPQQLRLWDWLSDYYMCSVGEVYKAALPSGLKLESESVVSANTEFEADRKLTARETAIYEFLSDGKPMSVGTIAKNTGIQNPLPVIKTLMEIGAVVMKEELRRSYKARFETRVCLAPNWQTEKAMHILLDSLRRVPKQQQLVMDYVELSGHLETDLRPVSKKELIERSGVSASVFAGLVSKGIFDTYEYVVGRIDDDAEKCETALNPLSEAQQKAYKGIIDSFADKDVTLLHGVTSSGKTEVYIHLIKKTIEEGRQVLYLLPEIALTTQITERLQRVFGSKMGVYHSKYPDAERVEIWQKQLSDTPFQLILGVRSSVFLPFQNLGLVIVDEEHEMSYKQQDPAPRYHARSAALVLAAMAKAKTLLGTATPSIETYYNAQSGKYGFVSLYERFKGVELPEIRVVDISELKRKKLMVGPFSPELLSRMRAALDGGEQVILFQNRRGFSPMVECNACGWVPKCSNCDVSLTYHKSQNRLTCHYCGYSYLLPSACPSCNEKKFRPVGYGTEKIQDAVLEVFPEAKVERMDLDTTRTRSAYERIISDFQTGKTDVLIGTQMISKGLDFDNVSVVGIINADTMLNLPDFRAYERAFQMMSQVAGRAGRRNRRGLVVLQTRSPELPVVGQVVRNDYRALYSDQMEERRMFSYPPFYRIIYMFIKSKDVQIADHAATEIATRLRQMLGDRVLGPDSPAVSRVQTYHIRKIIVKVEQQASMKKVRSVLSQVRDAFLATPTYHSVQVYYDVDPM